MQPNKSNFRQTFRNIRHQIPEEDRQTAAEKAAVHFAKHSFFKEHDHISCYISFQGEIDTMPLIREIWRANKICYLPVLMEGRALTFVRYDEGDVLQLNQLGIYEPENTSRKIAPEKIDIVVMPLVAFDLQGHRLGTGGGYYDRTFAFLHDAKSKKPLMIGFAYAAQQAESLPADPWDIKLDGVATEEEIILLACHNQAK